MNTDYFTKKLILNLCINIFILSSFVLINLSVIYVLYLPIYINYYQYKTHYCNISHVDYPNELPNKNSSHWIACKNNCHYACVKIYTNISNITYKIIDNYYYDDYHKQCSFDMDCVCSNESLQFQLSKSKLMYKMYYELKNVTCYYQDHISKIFLHKYYDLTNIIIIYILIGLIAAFIIIISLKYMLKYCKKVKINIVFPNNNDGNGNDENILLLENNEIN